MIEKAADFRAKPKCWWSQARMNACSARQDAMPWVSLGQPFEPIDRALRATVRLSANRGGRRRSRHAGSSGKPDGASPRPPRRRPASILEITRQAPASRIRAPLPDVDPHPRWLSPTSAGRPGRRSARVPASSLATIRPSVEHAASVSRSINPDWLVEIEADAVASEARGDRAWRRASPRTAAAWTR